MNECRATNYGDFAKIGMEKESARVQAGGVEKSGENVYKHIREEVKAMKERLRAAGVDRTEGGLNAEDSEDSEYDDEIDDTKKASADKSGEKQEHMPRIGANSTGKDFSKMAGGGIPRPVAKENNYTNATEISANPMRASGKDFRIMANSSRGSFGAMSGTESNMAKPINRLPKHRPNLIGANKPHMLKN